MNSLHQIENHLRRIQRKFSRFYSHILTEENLSIPQFSLMLIIADEEAKTMRELAQAMHLAPSSVTSLVDRLEKNKLLQRKKHPSDRRAFLIKITPQGEKIVQRIRKASVNRIAEVLTASINDSEVQTILKFYTLMETVLDESLINFKRKEQA